MKQDFPVRTFLQGKTCFSYKKSCFHYRGNRISLHATCSTLYANQSFFFKFVSSANTTSNIHQPQCNACNENRIPAMINEKSFPARQKRSCTTLDDFGGSNLQESCCKTFITLIYPTLIRFILLHSQATACATL